MSASTHKKKIVTLRMTSELDRMVSELEKALSTTKTEVITQAILDLYYRQLGRGSRFFESFEKAGLVGCFEGERNLSSRYKDTLTEELAKKHDNS